MCVCVCVCVCVCAHVGVRETDISRWVYVHVRVSSGSVGGQDGNIDYICAVYIAY